MNGIMNQVMARMVFLRLTGTEPNEEDSRQFVQDPRTRRAVSIAEIFDGLTVEEARRTMQVVEAIFWGCSQLAEIRRQVMQEGNRVPCPADSEASGETIRSSGPNTVPSQSGTSSYPSSSSVG